MVFTRHPVDIPNITQGWGELKTGGVIPNQYGTPIEQLVFNYGNYQPHGHDGWDYGCPIGTPVYAPGDCTIEFSGWGEDMPADIAAKYGFIHGPGGWPSGIVVCMAMDGAPIGAYVAHLSESYWDRGDKVKGGTLIALSGNSGRSGGPHVHFSAIRFPLNYSDPLYSRVNPGLYFTKAPTITPTPAAPKGELTVAEADRVIAEVNKYTAALLVNGYTIGGKKYAGTNAIVTVNQREQRETQAIVKNLVGAIAALSKGESFDEPKLLAGIQKAVYDSTKAAIESIESTTTVTLARPDGK